MKKDGGKESSFCVCVDSQPTTNKRKHMHTHMLHQHDKEGMVVVMAVVACFCAYLWRQDKGWEGGNNHTAQKKERNE